MSKVSVSSLISGNSFLNQEKQMRNIRGFTLGLVLRVGIALSGLAFAQNTNDQNKKADSCLSLIHI